MSAVSTPEKGTIDEAYAIDWLALADREAGRYAKARPFPHAVFDDFLPEAILDRVLAAFPNPQDLEWIEFVSPEERKLAFPVADKLPAPIRETLHFLNSSTMIRFLERLTGIAGLIPDPHYYGGGLHRIERGGHLEVHLDFTRAINMNVKRRLNLLLYLNRDWKEEYGGHLELWNEDMTRAEKRILPVFNRCAVFTTGEKSFHGHPHPLTCPEGSARKSLATYYYSLDESANAQPGEWESTRFQARPWPTPPWKRALKQIAPPIAVSAYKKLRGR